MLPSLLLLPIITFFTFSKVKVGGESRVRFSKKFTWVNMGVSAVGYVCWLVWFYHKTEFDPIIILCSLLPSSVFLTFLFLHLDRLYDCTGVPGEVISVFDPITDRRFIIKDGVVVEPPEEEEEVEPPEEDVLNGYTPFPSVCGCCCPVQEQNTDSITLDIYSDQQEVWIDDGEFSSDNGHDEDNFDDLYF